MIDINFMGKFCNLGALIFVISAACRSCRAAQRKLSLLRLPPQSIRVLASGTRIFFGYFSVLRYCASETTFQIDII